MDKNSCVKGIAVGTLVLIGLAGCGVEPGEQITEAGLANGAQAELPAETADDEVNLGTSQDALRTSNLTIYADVTGDGASEKITVTTSNAFLIGGKIWVKHGGSPLERGQIALVDLNGDKKKDLVVQGYDNRFWVSRSTGTTFTSPQNWVTHGGGGYRYGQAQYADLNADNKADLIYQATNNGFWVSISTGTGFTSPTNWVSHGGSFVAGQATYRDLNGDRRADLSFNNWVSYSTGTGFSKPAFRGVCRIDSYYRGPGLSCGWAYGGTREVKWPTSCVTTQSGYSYRCEVSGDLLEVATLIPQ